MPATTANPITASASLAKRSARPRRRLAADAGPRIGWVVATLLSALLFCAAMSFFSIRKYDNLWADMYDMGQELQVHWNTAHGRPFESSVEVQNNLGDHTAFISAATSLVYRLAPSPHTLLAWQALIFSLGIVPVYRLARRHLQSDSFAWLASAIYLGQPAAAFALGYEYHPLVYAAPLALLTLDLATAAPPPHLIAASRSPDANNEDASFDPASGSDRGVPTAPVARDAGDGPLEHTRSRRGRSSGAATRHRTLIAAWTAFASLLLVREDACLTAAAVGLLLLSRPDLRRHAIAMTLVGLAAFLLSSLVLLPMFRGEASDTLARYHHLGDSPGAILATLITDPGAWWRLAVDDPRRITFVPILMLPWLFTPARLWSFWPAVALVTLPGVLSNNPCQYTLGWHYPLTALPIVTYAAIVGAGMIRPMFKPEHGSASNASPDQSFPQRRVRGQQARLPNALTRKLSPCAKPRAVFALTLVVLLACQSRSVFVIQRSFMPNNPLREHLDRVASHLPEHASLSATGKLGAQFAERRQIAIYPITRWPEEKFPKLPERRAEYLLIDESYSLLLERHRVPDPSAYRLVAASGPIHLYRREAKPIVAPHAQARRATRGD